MFHTNHAPHLYHFRFIVSYLSKVRNFSYPMWILLPQWGWLGQWNFIKIFGNRKLESLATVQHCFTVMKCLAFWQNCDPRLGIHTFKWSKLYIMDWWITLYCVTQHYTLILQERLTTQNSAFISSVFLKHHSIYTLYMNSFCWGIMQ